MLAFKSFVTLALPLFVVATPLVQVRNDPPTTCNSGNLQCCQSTLSSSGSSVLSAGLLGLLGVGGILDGLIGSNCDSLSAVGLLGSGNKCDQQTLCCTGNNFGPSGTSSGFSIISFGCSPINIL